MKTKHTSTPWKIDEFGGIEGQNDRPVALTSGYTDNEKLKQCIEENKHNAEFIVRAINSHEELLEAVKSFDQYIRNNETGSHGECKLCKLIAKAEGK